MSRDWRKKFKDLCERTIELSLEDRMRYGFNYVYQPVLDDTDWRSFDSMEEYRSWCRQNLPEYLGYGTCDNLDQPTLDTLTAAITWREIERRKRLYTNRSR